MQYSHGKLSFEIGRVADSPIFTLSTTVNGFKAFGPERSRRVILLSDKLRKFRVLEIPFAREDSGNVKKNTGKRTALSS